MLRRTIFLTYHKNRKKDIISNNKTSLIRYNHKLQN